MIEFQEVDLPRTNGVPNDYHHGIGPLPVVRFYRMLPPRFGGPMRSDLQVIQGRYRRPGNGDVVSLLHRI